MSFSWKTAFFVLSLGLWTSSAWAKPYTVEKGGEIRVDVHHPAKHVIAKTSDVSGSIEVEDKTLASKSLGLSGSLKVAVRSLKSGNKRRDNKMWESLGDDDIVFKPKTLVVTGEGKGTIQGLFTIRGTERPVTLDVTFQGALDGKAKVTMTIKGKVKCSDFKVPRPSLMFVAIKDDVDMSFKLTFVPKG